jgi:DNA-binding winged helix-turn-helix (wHTH) protein
VIYRFNQCTLDTERYQLSLRDKPVSVEPLVFDLLVYLVEKRDRVVTREELLDKLWSGKVVTDSALGARLKDAHKATQDSGS